MKKRADFYNFFMMEKLMKKLQKHLKEHVEA